MNRLVLTVWLSLACTPASSSFASLVHRFETPERIYETDEDDLRHAIGSKSADFAALADKDLTKAEETVNYCERHSIGIVTYFDREFPSALRKIPNPPVLLYYRGTLPDFDAVYCAAVVGTRRLSDYGRRMAFSVSADLARSGAVIVSGMAVGIDGVALAGGLSEEKPTVAVLGCGINICYPEEHLALAREIVRRGCILTEYAPGTQPDRTTFPRRNRLISGIANAVLVIEGRARSGSLITARYAKEQGKPLYALPGNVDAPTGAATSLLLRDGVKGFLSAYDIVRDSELDAPGKLSPFLLGEERKMGQEEALLRFHVSAVAPSDGIFRPAKPKKNKKNGKGEPSGNSTGTPTASAAENRTDLSEKIGKLDAGTRAVYEKIPEGEAGIQVDLLSDGTTPTRAVLQALLRLEMAGLTEMLPGEAVRRKT